MIIGINVQMLRMILTQISPIASLVFVDTITLMLVKVSKHNITVAIGACYTGEIVFSVSIMGNVLGIIGAFLEHY